MDLSPAADADPMQAVWLQQLGLADHAARTSLRLLDRRSGAPQVVWLGRRLRAKARGRGRARARVRVGARVRVRVRVRPLVIPILLWYA